MGDIFNYYLTKFFDNTIIIFLLTTILSTLLVLITAEYIPKTLFKLQADSLIFAFAPAFRVAHVILWPLILLTKFLSSLVLCFQSREYYEWFFKSLSVVWRLRKLLLLHDIVSFCSELNLERGCNKPE